MISRLIVVTGIVLVLFYNIPSVFGQNFNDFERLKRLADEIKNTIQEDAILDVLIEYQKETGEFNTSGLSIDQILNEIQQWYDTTEPKPKMTKEVIINKYLEIVANAPPPETIDDKLNRVFNN